jgi:DNA-binding MarR family transcriptional regulator
MQYVDKELTILENIYQKPQKIRQRDLAHIAGVSLGMTNTIMKRLIGKGFLVASKINGKNIHYAVTPSGIKEIMRRSFTYFKRTIKDIVYYKEKIERMIADIKKLGYSTIRLIGTSDLDFLIEHYCQKDAVAFLVQNDDHPAPPASDGVFYLISENITKNPFGYEPHIALYEMLYDFVK